MDPRTTCGDDLVNSVGGYGSRNTDTGGTPVPEQETWRRPGY